MMKTVPKLIVKVHLVLVAVEISIYLSMKNATLRQLRIFSEVARHLSFARTAETLHLTSPAISQQIKALEDHVGSPLFDREGKKIALTPTGKHMLQHVRRILAQVKDAEVALLRLKELKTGGWILNLR